jgi:hypothetical protein
MAVSAAFFLVFVLVMLFRRHEFSLHPELQQLLEAGEVTRRRSSGHSDTIHSPSKQSGKKQKQKLSTIT